MTANGPHAEPRVLPDLFAPLTSGPVPPRGEDVAEALLTKQTLPAVKSMNEELPPLFATESFTLKIAETLAPLAGTPKKIIWRSYTRIRSRRYDGLVRTMGIPHPLPYSRLILHVSEHWNKLRRYLDSENSAIKPSNFKDGRVILMNYERGLGRIVNQSREAQGMQFRIDADISNCFPSVYTHSLDWALRGYSDAKKTPNHEGWEGQLDKLTQCCHYGETTGLMIGPAITNILAELVLQRVDNCLRDQGFSNFVRYIDDYTTHSQTLAEAERFLTTLDRALADYRLTLNSKKTRITPLRNVRPDPWIHNISTSLPLTDSGAAWARYLQFLELTAQENPHSSVLTFGVKILMGRLSVPPLTGRRQVLPQFNLHIPVLEELARLTYFHPHLAPHLVRLLRFCQPLLERNDRDRLGAHIQLILSDAIRRRETDVGLWMVYALRQVLRVNIPKTLVDEALRSNDDLLILSIAAYSKRARIWASRWAAEIDTEDDMACDEHWMARYELFRWGNLPIHRLQAEREAKWFCKAKDSGLQFTTIE